MNKEQLEHFARILQTWKRDLMVEVDRTVLHMKDEAANFPDPNDRATQEEEFSLELRTRDRERKLIRKIDEALKRIEDGSYGYCLGNRRRDRHQAAGSPSGRHSVGRSAGAARAPRKAIRRPRRPVPIAATLPGQRRLTLGGLRPTPSGDLHLGSLYTAVGKLPGCSRAWRPLAAAHRGSRSAQRDRGSGGRDPAHLGAIRLRMGRSRHAANATAASTTRRRSRALQAQQRTFACACSRAQLEDELRYPGTCRTRQLTADAGSHPPAGRAWARAVHRSHPRDVSPERRGRRRRFHSEAPRSASMPMCSQWRSMTPRRALPHIVRGADLLDNTPRQVYLQRLLGLPNPATPMCRY